MEGAGEGIQFVQVEGVLQGLLPLPLAVPDGTGIGVAGLSLGLVGDQVCSWTP